MRKKTRKIQLQNNKVGGGSRERRKEGEEGVCGAKVYNPKPAINLLHPVGVEDYHRRLSIDLLASAPLRAHSLFGCGQLPLHF